MEPILIALRPGRSWRASAASVATSTLLAVAVSMPAHAADWAQWRGPTQDGVSEQTGLISSWSHGGEHQLWRSDFIGRSTPVVLDGRVYVTGRAGAGETMREVVAAFDAENGVKLWEHSIPTALTTVPFTRGGWSGPAADSETGYVYVQGVAGPLVAYDRDGKLVWEHDLYEAFGRYSGYGGRTHTPLVDEDRVIVSVINTSWGRLGAPRHRYFAFDKRTGEVLWIATPGNQPDDLNTQGHGTIAVVGGQRLFIAANADGYLYALNARTGALIWKFQVSKGYLNSTPVVADGVVYIGHGEENVDEATMGRTIAIDATGSGDITATNEVWRQPIAMGFPSPAVDGDLLYVLDNSANLFCLDRKTGAQLWRHNLGTVGKSAPVIADGKLYVTEVNGKLHILEANRAGVRSLDVEEITMPEGRAAEIFSSPAIAYGRIYFTTEEGLYALGDPRREFEVTASPPQKFAEEGAGSREPRTLLVVPGDTTVRLSDTVRYRVLAYNELGQPLPASTLTWSLDGLAGEISASGSLGFTAATHQAGEVVARVGEVEGRARVRAFGELPYREDFEGISGRGRPWWIGGGRYQVIEQDGGKVLEKPVPPSGLARSNLLIGPHFFSDYTVQADVRITQTGRRRGDVGLINAGYSLDLRGVQQKLELNTWEAEKRVFAVQPFSAEIDTWYTMKLRVEPDPKRTVALGKIWKRGEPEPAEWMIRIEDPLPTLSGAPGVVAYSPSPVYYDNLQVTVNE